MKTNKTLDLPLGTITSSAEKIKMESNSTAYPVSAEELIELLDNKIDAISSATITTKAIVNCVNAGLAYFDLLPSGNGGEA